MKKFRFLLFWFLIISCKLDPSLGYAEDKYIYFTIKDLKPNNINKAVLYSNNTPVAYYDSIFNDGASIDNNFITNDKLVLKIYPDIKNGIYKFLELKIEFLDKEKLKIYKFEEKTININYKNENIIIF